MGSDRKCALIPGGARGIGRAVAIALARDGWNVAITYRKSVDDAESLVREITAIGGRAETYVCDVSVATAAAAIVAEAEKSLGRIDALVNTFGPYHRVALLDETVEGWHEMFDHNLHPIFYLARAVAPGMKQRGWGRIVNFSMANADQLIGQTHVTAHYIAKVGVLVLTRSLAKTLAPHGITANAVSPGFIDSGSAPSGELNKMLKTIPAGAIGTVDDAVGAVRYLLSDAAAYVNGTNIHVSGAWGV